MRFRFLVLVTSLCALLSHSVAVRAGDHEPPKVVLSSGDTTQRGRLGTYCWWQPDGDSLVLHCVDAVYSWPRARAVRAGARARIRFMSADAPTRLRLSAWRRVDDFGIPAGRRRRISYHLKPVTVDGAVVAHDAVIRLPRRTGRHHYVSAFGRWADQDDAGQDQHAQWTFHLRLGPRGLRGRE